MVVPEMLRAVLQRAVLARAACCILLASLIPPRQAWLVSCMAEGNSFHCLAELFCIALCLASVSFACGTSMTLLTTLKNLLFSVFLGIANGNRVREQPSL